MIYLDNAATSFPKPDSVSDEINRCMAEYCANPGRGGHQMSVLSGQAVMEVRETVSDFFGIDNPLQLCFMKNATEALNIAMKGLLTSGDHVITTSMEHNSVIRPLKLMERDGGIALTIIRGNDYGEIDPDAVYKKMKSTTKLIVCTLSSNVNGIVMPVEEIGRMARERGIPFLLDASQGAGSLQIDVKAMNVDMLAFPGHKGLLGPQGTGGLYVRDGMDIKPILQGGTGSRSESVYQPEFMPDMLESGTLNTPGIVGLGAGIKFIGSFGIGNMKLYKHKLVERLTDGFGEIRGVKNYSRSPAVGNSGIVAIHLAGMESAQVSQLLDRKYGIATRAGLHCAPLAHETLGTLETGLVRFSVGCFNTMDEIDRTLEAVREISHGAG